MSTAFVLSGEGAKAAFQAGIILRLESEGIKPDFICGSSSGALTSAVYSHVGSKGLIDLWGGVKGIGDVFNFQWNFLTRQGFFGHKPVQDILTDVVMRNDRRIPAMCNRVNMVTNEFQRIFSDVATKQEYIDGTLSSISIPALVEPFDEQWVDGGARELAPLKSAIDRGATDIWVLLATPPQYQANPPLKGLFSLFGIPFLRIAEIGAYAVDFLLMQNMMNDIKVALEKNSNPDYRQLNIRILGPKTHIGSPLGFNVAQAWIAKGMNEAVSYDPEAILGT